MNSNHRIKESPQQPSKFQNPSTSMPGNSLILSFNAKSFGNNLAINVTNKNFSTKIFINNPMPKVYAASGNKFSILDNLPEIKEVEKKSLFL